MKDDARRAVAGLLVAVGAVAAALAPVLGGHHPATLTIFVTGAVIAAVLAILVELPDLKLLLDGRLSVLGFHRSRAVSLPAPAIPGGWLYTSDGSRASAAMRAGELMLPGTGFRLEPDDRQPWVRFVVQIACSQIAPTLDPGQIWPLFMNFLKSQPVTSLVNGLTRPAPGIWWTRWATSSAGTVNALYTPGGEIEAAASARLELPDGTRRYGHDERYGTLILHFEPPQSSADRGSAAGPVAWTDHMMRALELPAALDQFLNEQLGVSTSADPPAVLGFRLETPHSLTELIDITALAELPGGHHKREAIGYFIADPQGARADRAADQMISDVLLYGLQAER
ncbi:MAG: hypothetical protein ACYCO9_08465 [Streptosporangiaceae bacterium]